MQHYLWDVELRRKKLKTEAPKTETAVKSDTTIGLSTDEGGLNDKSFNQSANEGVKKAKAEDGFKYNAIESKKKEDYTANLESLVENGSDLTFAIGYPNVRCNDRGC